MARSMSTQLGINFLKTHTTQSTLDNQKMPPIAKGGITVTHNHQN
uniref:Uncharacterized protein n=1 Tax=Rhizophora mucronata TaxID=61149 RepID=A0A2P2N925_RHIMU